MLGGSHFPTFPPNKKSDDPSNLGPEHASDAHQVVPVAGLVRGKTKWWFHGDLMVISSDFMVILGGWIGSNGDLTLSGGFLSHRATPSHHPFRRGIFPFTKTTAWLGIPHDELETRKNWHFAKLTTDVGIGEFEAGANADIMAIHGNSTAAFSWNTMVRQQTFGHILMLLFCLT